MGDAPLMVGVSGLRGIVGKSLTPEVAVRYAGAFGGWLGEQVSGRAPFVVVGYDGRMGGEAVYTTVIAALQASGVRVRRLGVAMTPAVGLVCDLVGADAGVVVTASHNSQEWNGIKLLLRQASWNLDGRDAGGDGDRLEPDACAPDAETAREIVSAFEAGRVAWLEQERLEDQSSDDDVEHPHCERVLDRCGELVGAPGGDFWGWFEAQRQMMVVMDSLNSSGVRVSYELFQDTPCRAIHLYDSYSGKFPHGAEPTAENLAGAGGLCDAVPGLKADIGFAQDPDGDRLAIVDETGRYIGEEYTLALCAEAVLLGREHGGGAPVLVANLSTSRMIDDVAARYGARVVRTAVGEANVVEAMKALRDRGESVVLGGEGNGGVIWQEVVYVRDSLSSMALVLSLMARTGKSVSELVSQINSYSAGGAGYAIEKRKQPLASKEDAKPAVERIAKAWEAKGARVDLQDGVRVDQDDAWVHVRASNTEPILRLIAEAPTREGATALLDDVGTLVG